MNSSVQVVPVGSFGAEDVLVGVAGPRAGQVITGTADGAIVAVKPDAHSTIDHVGSVRGRPLGIEWYPDGRLLICDADHGLVLMDPATGATEALVTEVEGRPMAFCNNASVAADGTIWFSDSSAHFGIKEWKKDFIINTHTGRLLRRTPDGQVDVVLRGLGFANGVALTADESRVIVAETSEGTLVSIPTSGHADPDDHPLLVHGMPGYPDNIARGTDGLIWVAIAGPTDALASRLHKSPVWVRKAAAALPEALSPNAKPIIRVQAYDEDGVLVRDIDTKHPGFHMVTGVREHEGRLWMGSLQEAAVAVIDL